MNLSTNFNQIINTPLPTKTKAIRSSYEENYDKFLLNVFPKDFEVKYGIPWWNLYYWYMITVEKKTRFVNIVPRKHAKTTGSTFGHAMYQILYKKKRYIVLISNTTEQAASYLERIRWHFQYNGFLREVYGDMTAEYIGEDLDIDESNVMRSKKWNSKIIRCSNGVAVAALGAGKSMRGILDLGLPPDMVYGDDIEDKKNTNTIDLRKAIGDWWIEVVMQLGTDSCQYQYNGTIPHHDSLATALLKNTVWEKLFLRAALTDEELKNLRRELPTYFANLMLSQIKTIEEEDNIFKPYRHIIWGKRYTYQYFKDKLEDARQTVIGGKDKEPSFWQEVFNLPKSEKEKVFTYFPTIELEIRDAIAA